MPMVMMLAPASHSLDEPCWGHTFMRNRFIPRASLGRCPDTVRTRMREMRRGVAGKYNRAEYLEEKRGALEAWATHVEALTSSTGPPVP